MPSDNNNKFYAINKENWGHKWGFKDSRFIINDDRTVTLTGNRYDMCGKKLPYMIPFVEKYLGIKIDKNDIKKEKQVKVVKEKFINSKFLKELTNLFDSDRFSTMDNERLIHSHGQTTSDEVYKVLYSHLEKFVDLVFYIEDEDELIKLIDLAKTHHICLIPYGGGTSVSNALQLPIKEKRMIVSIDTRRMNKIKLIDETNRLVTVEAGITGKKLEEELNEKGYTVGHEPDSIEFSTVGGWISTNAAGMKKHKYGNIEDIVQNITMITPNGKINQIKPLTRSSIGIKTQNILFGSEGNFGLITEATLKVHRLPDVSSYESALFKNWKDGKSFMYDLSQANYIPASVRLMDNLMLQLGQALKEEKKGIKKQLDKIKQFILVDVKGFRPDDLVAVTFKMEGTLVEVNYQKENLTKLAKKHSGIMSGESIGKSGYRATAAIAYIRDFLFDYHFIGETMETSIPWSDLDKVRDNAKECFFKLHKEYKLPGKPFFCSRMTKVYHTGACLYTTLAISTKDINNPEDVFSKIEHEVRKNIMDNGGSISHHHGVGKLRKDFMDKTLSKGSVQLLKNIKNTEDPDNIFGIKNNIFSD